MTAPAGPDRFADVLLSCLLPGDGDWPAASDTQAPAQFAERMTQSAPLTAAVDWLRSSALGAGLTAHLQACEAADPARFALIVTEAFNAYYTDPVVLAVIERKTGFPARPPQPAGHALEPFDWSVLESRKRRE
jgi:hypothetical protein